MTIVGFNFTKMLVERNEGAKGKVNIKNNVSIKEISEANLSVGGDKQKSVKFVFDFVSAYEPEVGKINLIGDVLFLEESSKVEKILKDWNDNKKVEKNLMSNIMNTVLAKCNVQALILSQSVNLPSPIPLPKVKMEEGQKK